jgi:hypothetical protein
MEAWMSTTPRELLDTSIAQLETLRAFLGEQLVARTEQSESDAASDVIACQEILISLGTLILRIQSACPAGSACFCSEHR